MSTSSNNRLSLDSNEIHLWFTHPQKISDGVLLKHYESLLTTDELARRDRYRFAQDQHDALITRAFVRDLLSRYCAVDAKDFRFIKGEKDKPEIAQPPLPLRFNISHTKDLIACAVCLNDDIGCDVENISRQNDVLAIADRYFSQQETSELFSLESSQQYSRFFDYWTLKESYIKACGQGLAIPLGDFSFHIKGEAQARLNENISLSFAPQRNDTPEHWHSWLLYPNELHRIALSINANNAASTAYKLRFFNSTPLISHTEVEFPF